ncbi:MAG: prepilin-type N-terminal cleavage/methylation domain-containing protein, partial [Planctomycetota bacterium]
MKGLSSNYQFSKVLYGGCGNYLLKRGGLNRAGFTLIEIIVVVVVIALAAVMAIPMMSSAGTFQIQSAANMIAADLEYAKGLAIGKGQVFSVVFDANTESYWIENQNGSVIEHPVK